MCLVSCTRILGATYSILLCKQPLGVGNSVFWIPKESPPRPQEYSCLVQVEDDCFLQLIPSSCYCSPTLTVDKMQYTDHLHPSGYKGMVSVLPRVSC